MGKLGNGDLTKDRMIAHHHRGTLQCLHPVFHKVWYVYMSSGLHFSENTLPIFCYSPWVRMFRPNDYKHSSVLFINVLTGNISEDDQ